MSDIVGNQNCWFSHAIVQFVFEPNKVVLRPGARCMDHLAHNKDIKMLNTKYLNDLTNFKVTK